MRRYREGGGDVFMDGVRYLVRDEDDPLTVIDVGELSEFRNWYIETARSISLRRLAHDGQEYPMMFAWEAAGYPIAVK